MSTTVPYWSNIQTFMVLLSWSELATIEPVRIQLKRHLGFRRLRLRGLTGASDEFLLVAIVQILKKLAASSRTDHQLAESIA